MVDECKEKTEINRPILSQASKKCKLHKFDTSLIIIFIHCINEIEKEEALTVSN